MPDLTYREATPDDLELLKGWDLEADVLSASGEDDFEDWEGELPRKPPWRLWLIFEEVGRPIGSVQIIDPHHEETHYWEDIEEDLRAIDIWLGQASDRNRGLGTEMMKLSLQLCFTAAEVKAVVIDPLEANTKAIRFYERLGFRALAPRRFGEDDCLVMRIERSEWITGARSQPHRPTQSMAPVSVSSSALVRGRSP